ncbi:MAG TPA: hemin uptake protein HemP [Methylovirgula sp.]|nr:hemin uptake protein HemP [Methylovirgula sp.]
MAQSESQDTRHTQSITQTPRTISSRELLGNDKVVIIRHEQEDYRLRITATGKLILTK